MALEPNKESGAGSTQSNHGRGNGHDTCRWRARQETFMALVSEPQSGKLSKSGTVGKSVSRRVLHPSSLFKLESQNGDLDANFATYHIRNIQVKDSLGCFLTRSSTEEVELAEMDETDGEQLWLINQSLFRRFFHARTREYLALPQQLVKFSDDATDFQVWWWGPKLDSNGCVDMWWAVDANVRPYGHSINKKTPFIAQPPLNMFGFIRTSSQLNLCSTRQQLEAFLRANAPVVVQDKTCADNRAVSIDDYLETTSLSQQGRAPYSTSWLTEEPFNGSRPFALSPVKVPIGLSHTPIAYVTVRSAADPDYRDYTNAIYHLFFPRSRIGFTHGWRSISCYYTNTTQRLGVACIGISNWMPNIDCNIMIVTIEDIRKLLETITNKKSQKVSLHVYLDENLKLSLTFQIHRLYLEQSHRAESSAQSPPKSRSKQRRSGTRSFPIRRIWGFTWDVGQAVQHELTEAHILTDCGPDDRPIPPQWNRYQGYWSNGVTLVTGDPEQTGRFSLSWD